MLYRVGEFDLSLSPFFDEFLVLELFIETVVVLDHSRLTWSVPSTKVGVKKFRSRLNLGIVAAPAVSPYPVPEGFGGKECFSSTVLRAERLGMRVSCLD